MHDCVYGMYSITIDVMSLYGLFLTFCGLRTTMEKTIEIAKRSSQSNSREVDT